MTKKKLIEDIKHSPARIYRLPADVLRDRRFGDVERLEILRAWRESDMGGDDAINVLIAELENRLAAASGHAAE